jgi:hypothetical protein
MAITIDTTEYVAAHAKQPRGYGLWAFSFDAAAEIFTCTGTFSVAKKTAVALAVSRGHHTVRVRS